MTLLGAPPNAGEQGPCSVPALLAPGLPACRHQQAPCVCCQGRLPASGKPDTCSAAALSGRPVNQQGPLAGLCACRLQALDAGGLSGCRLALHGAGAATVSSPSVAWRIVVLHLSCARVLADHLYTV